MKQAMIVVLLGLMLIPLGGCSSSPGDAAMQAQIKAMNEFADAIESGKTSKEQMDGLKKRMEDVEKQLKELNLTDADKKSLAEKHKDAITKASQRVAGALMKGIIPGGKQN